MMKLGGMPERRRCTKDRNVIELDWEGGMM